MTEVNVNDLIGAEFEGSGERDPSVIAARVAMRLSAKDARTVLAEVLRDRVRMQIGRARMAAYDRTAVDPDDQAGRPVSRWERHQALLGQGVFVRDGYKLMADCTVGDFEWLAEDREARAVELASVAARYRAHAADMRAAGAARFAELFDAVEQVAA